MQLNLSTIIATLEWIWQWPLFRWLLVEVRLSVFDEGNPTGIGYQNPDLHNLLNVYLAFLISNNIIDGFMQNGCTSKK